MASFKQELEIIDPSEECKYIEIQTDPKNDFYNYDLSGNNIIYHENQIVRLVLKCIRFRNLYKTPLKIIVTVQSKNVSYYCEGYFKLVKKVVMSKSVIIMCNMLY